MRLSPVLCALVLWCGCQTPPSPGASCTRPSDCASPLVCRLARCRTECTMNRDCGAGRLCLIDAEGNGACAVAEDACASACTGGLVCRDAICVQACTTDTQCPRDGHCEVDVCAAGMGPSADAGPSDADVSRPCTADRDCPSGMVCDLYPTAGGLAVPVCRAQCTQSSECPSGSWCVSTSFTGDAGNGGVCTPVCDPVTAAGCPAGTKCAVSLGNDVQGASITYAECVLPGATAEGCDCSGGLSEECAGNTSCRFVSASIATCSTLCVIDTLCADGTPCQADTPRYVAGGIAYGYCPAPACP